MKRLPLVAALLLAVSLVLVPGAATAGQPPRAAWTLAGLNRKVPQVGLGHPGLPSGPSGSGFEVTASGHGQARSGVSEGIYHRVSASATLAGRTDSVEAIWAEGSALYWIEVQHPDGASEQFLWDGSVLRVIISDGRGNRHGAVTNSNAHWMASELEWWYSDRSLARPASDLLEPPKIRFEQLADASEAEWLDVAKRFLAEFSGLPVSNLVNTVSTTFNGAVDASVGVLGNGQSLAGETVLSTGSSGYTSGWALGLWGRLCVYKYSYRNLDNNNYWYVSSTTYNDCYYVDVSAWGDSYVQGTGSCQPDVWRGGGPTSTTRSVLVTSWPAFGYPLSSTACSNHWGWDRDWYLIAPFSGLDAWQP